MSVAVLDPSFGSGLGCPEKGAATKKPYPRLRKSIDRISFRISGEIDAQLRKLINLGAGFLHENILEQGKDFSEQRHFDTTYRFCYFLYSVAQLKAPFAAGSDLCILGLPPTERCGIESDSCCAVSMCSKKKVWHNFAFGTKCAGEEC